MKRLLVLMFSLVLILCLFGCGGSGDSVSDGQQDTTDNTSDTTDMSDASLNGTYIYTTFTDSDVNNGTGGYSKTHLFELTADGSGSATYLELEDSSGTPDSGTGPYAVFSDGSIEFGDGVNSLDTGVLSPDGNAFTVVDTNASDDWISLMVGLKKSSGMSNASLNGTYVVNYFIDDEVDSGGNTITKKREMTFDGAGNVATTTIQSSNGSADSGNYTYSVSSDGTVSIAGLLPGVVSPDGNVIIFLDTDASDNKVSILVGMKKSSGMSNASLNGTYVVNQLMDDEIASGGYTITNSMEMIFDGAGNVSYTTLQSSIGDTSSGDNTYSVSSDGSVELPDGVTGIVSPDGSAFTAVDTDESYDDLSIFVGMKMDI